MTWCIGTRAWNGCCARRPRPTAEDSRSGTRSPHGWLPAYPETTGYIIPTLWDAFALRADERFRAAAIAAADWEIAIQLPCGATRAGYEGES